MQKTEPFVSTIAALMLGCLSLMMSPGCTVSRAISARIDFAIHAQESELSISVNASVRLQQTETSDSSPSRSVTVTEP